MSNTRKKRLLPFLHLVFATVAVVVVVAVAVAVGRTKRRTKNSNVHLLLDLTHVIFQINKASLIPFCFCCVCSGKKGERGRKEKELVIVTAWTSNDLILDAENAIHWSNHFCGSTDTLWVGPFCLVFLSSL